MEEILLIEELATQAWPAEIIDPLDGWRLRWHRVPSRRVNSVWPNAWGGQIPLAIKLQRVEEFYMIRGQAACYQICPAALPEGLDDVLEAQGYVQKSLTAVQVTKVDTVLAHSSSLIDGKAQVDVLESMTEEWLVGYCLTQDESLERLAPRRDALSRVDRKVAYGMVRDENGEVAAVGRGILDGEWLGIFGMATGMSFRRRGYATAVLGTLGRWAQASGAENMYLQVMENNPGAKALYERVGFRTRYHYHYREKHLAPDDHRG